MNNYKLGSLFDGSGGFPLAGALCGIEPVWAAEVEPYPIAVTRSRFPRMKHLGDISKVNGAEIEPVDIITFGSPCQDLSVAGKRAGLKHTDNGDEETTRSGLFMEAVRIIKEMRKATNGNYPRFAIWENVPGAFSSNNGEDFRIVCEELIKIVEPSAFMPSVPKNGWNYADSFVGDGWSLAYRVFDAQYWGVPQRRRRIYLVADFRGECAREVLFEREGLRGYFETGRTPWQAAPSDAEGSTGADDRTGDTRGGDRGRQLDDVTYIIDNVGGQAEYAKASEVNGTLRAGAQGLVAYAVENHPADSPAVAFAEPTTVEGEKIAGTLMARDYKGLGRWDTVSRIVCSNYIVRRLTPTECARLQGFADRWGWIEEKKALTEEEYKFWMEVRNTHARINGKKEQEYTAKQMLTWYNKLWTDSAEYKMWGNGIALPTALYCVQGMAEVLARPVVIGDDDDWMN